MEEQPDLLWPPMEQLGLSWAPVEQKDTELHGLLADRHLRLASAAAIGLQAAVPALICSALAGAGGRGSVAPGRGEAGERAARGESRVAVRLARTGPGLGAASAAAPAQRHRMARDQLEDEETRFDNPAHDDDATMILQLLKEPRDEGDLDRWLSGDLHSSTSQGTNVDHQMEGTRSFSGGNLSFPSKKRGTRKKRMSPWKPLFFEMRRSASASRVRTQRKNNSRWTHEEVESLVDGISEYGIGRWTELKGKYFKQSIRTSMNLKDKWRNLLKSYDVKFTYKTTKVQKTPLLHLEQPLIKRIMGLAEKHRRGCEAALSDSSSNTIIDSFLTV